jgi:hypothetical protein
MISRSTQLKLRKVIREEVKRVLKESARPARGKFTNRRKNRWLTEETTADFEDDQIVVTLSNGSTDVISDLDDYADWLSMQDVGFEEMTADDLQDYYEFAGMDTLGLHAEKYLNEQ